MADLLRRYGLALIGLALILLVPLAVYHRLPDPMPTHWNLSGEVDGWMPRRWGAALMPMISLVTTLLMIAAPRLSPRGFGMASLERTYPWIVTAVVCFELYLSALILNAALNGAALTVGQPFTVIGLLLAVLGNYFGKTTRNFFFGVRTPWTMADDEVWRRTHRLAAPLFVAGGIVLMLIGSTQATPEYLALATLSIVVIVPVVYSYLLWRLIRERGNPNAAAPYKERD